MSRDLTKSERALWQKVTKGIRTNTVLPIEKMSEEFLALKTEKSLQRQKPPALPTHNLLTNGGAKKNQQQSLLEAGDPRSIRHIHRGKRDIDATLDLHGMTQDQAYGKFQSFLQVAKLREYRVLLIITGKGRNMGSAAEVGFGDSRGVLKRRFVQWAEDIFRDDIASVKQAHQKHGGSGAYYVILKSKRSKS